MERTSFWARVLRHTVWHPDAIPTDEWKYRSLTRLWLPIFDVLGMAASVWAVIYGSPILNRIFMSDALVNVLGFTMFLISFACLVCVITPVLWRAEIAFKLLLMAALAGYSTCILIMTPFSEWFPACIILMTIPLPMFRLSLLGEEIKERRTTTEEANT